MPNRLGVSEITTVAAHCGFSINIHAEKVRSANIIGGEVMMQLQLEIVHVRTLALALMCDRGS